MSHPCFTSELKQTRIDRPFAWLGEFVWAAKAYVVKHVGEVNKSATYTRGLHVLLSSYSNYCRTQTKHTHTYTFFLSPPLPLSLTHSRFLILSSATSHSLVPQSFLLSSFSCPSSFFYPFPRSNNYISWTCKGSLSFSLLLLILIFPPACTVYRSIIPKSWSLSLKKKSIDQKYRNLNHKKII